MSMPETKTASQQLREALHHKGYWREAIRFLEATPTQHRRFDYYRKGAQLVLLETVYEYDGGFELACELYFPATTSNSIADTIAAIP